jgi:hypothetical protein
MAPKKARKKKVAAKRQAWNKGLEIGKKHAFTPDQVKRIRRILVKRDASGLRDLALFSTAILWNAEQFAAADVIGRQPAGLDRNEEDEAGSGPCGFRVPRGPYGKPFVFTRQHPLKSRAFFSRPTLYANHLVYV